MKELTPEEQDFINRSLKKDVFTQEKAKRKGKTRLWEIAMLLLAIASFLFTLFLTYVYFQIETVIDFETIELLENENFNENMQLLSQEGDVWNLENAISFYKFFPFIIGGTSVITAILIIVYMILLHSRNTKNYEELLEKARKRKRENNG